MNLGLDIGTKEVSPPFAQDLATVRKNYETSLAFLSLQRKNNDSFNLNLELGTKLSFAEFLIKQGELLSAETQIREARTLALSRGTTYKVTLDKCDSLTKLIQKHES